MKWKKITDETVFPEHYIVWNPETDRIADFNKYFHVTKLENHPYTHYCEITPPDYDGIEIEKNQNEKIKYARMTEQESVELKQEVLKMAREYTDSIKEPSWEEKFRWKTFRMILKDYIRAGEMLDKSLLEQITKVVSSTIKELKKEK